VRKRKKSYKKIAFVLSLAAIIVWTMLGTGASLAWFSDTSGEVKNIFHMAEFDLVVSKRTEDGSYEEINAQTKIFDDEALYEPGYVQVVYLKIENRGTVPFNFETAVSVNDYIPAVNVFGRMFNLQDYLKFGVAFAESESELEEKVTPRENATAIATMPLNNYSTEKARLKAGDEVYMALVVRMPKKVANEANYIGNTQPKVELGVIVNATQIKK